MPDQKLLSEHENALIVSGEVSRAQIYIGIAIEIVKLALAILMLALVIWFIVADPWGFTRFAIEHGGDLVKCPYAPERCVMWL